MTVHPAHLSDIRNRSYARRVVKDDAGRRRMTHAELGVDLSSYVVPDCRKDVIVHHPFGGGRRETVALRMLKLTAGLRRIVSDALSGLPESYNAIHLRNTDLVASFDDARTQIALLDPTVPIFVASDNSASLAEISQMCPQNEFFSLATTFSADGKPLQYNRALDARQRNIEVLIDLVALASSESLVLPVIARGGKRLSGFSRLAKELQNDPALLSQLVFADDQR